MIEKFNFYDVYGYFLPGALFLAILWIPFGIASGSWPPTDWTSALIAVGIAYILGHLIQNVATRAIPSRRTKGPTGKIRNPSEIYLDKDNTELPDPVKEKIAGFVNAQFGLVLRINNSEEELVKSSEIEKVDDDRNNAFLLARQVLIQGKAVSYAEQFQGMYALTRGLFSVLVLGFAYWLGWAGSVLRWGLLVNIAIVVLPLALLLLILVNIAVLRNIHLAMFWKTSDPFAKRMVDRIANFGYAGVLLVALLAMGYLLGLSREAKPQNSALLAIFAAFALIASLRAFGAYEYFATRFASTVWRDYLAYNVKGDAAKDEAKS